MKLSVSLRALSALLFFSISLGASAHTALTKSTPAADSTVKEPPTHISLVFSEAVRLVKFEVMGVGHEMPTGFEPSTDEATEFRIETPNMHPGKFTVNWAVIGDDGHTVANSYGFVVDPAAEAAAE